MCLLTGRINSEEHPDNFLAGEGSSQSWTLLWNLVFSSSSLTKFVFSTQPRTVSGKGFRPVLVLSHPLLGLQIKAGPSAKPLPVLVGPGLLSLSPHLVLYVCIPFLLSPILRPISFLSGTSSFILRYPFRITIILQHCLKNRHTYIRKHPLFLCVNIKLFSSALSLWIYLPSSFFDLPLESGLPWRLSGKESACQCRRCRRRRFDSLEKETATHSSILAWEIPSTGKQHWVSSPAVVLGSVGCFIHTLHESLCDAHHPSVHLHVSLFCVWSLLCFQAHYFSR